MRVSVAYRRLFLASAAVFLLLWLIHSRLQHAEELVQSLRAQLKRLKEMPEPTGSTILFLPSFLDIYPHLADVKDLTLLNPPVRIPDLTPPAVEVVLGIPAVERVNSSYLESTLAMLLSRASPSDLSRFRIVVMLSHPNGTEAPFVTRMAAWIQKTFPDSVRGALIQIISPPPAWYPDDLVNVEPTFGDNQLRMFWRTKQNLDYAYLLSYCRNMAKYYMQLEDDIEPAPDYSSKIFYEIERAPANWSLLEFSSLGVIGKLMRSSDTSKIAAHILMNHRYKPIDWLIADFFTNRFCSPEMSGSKCNKALKEARIVVRPPLFQHVGFYSSLPGKIQKLRERTFSRTKMEAAVQGGDNPPAIMSTSMASHLSYTLSALYKRQHAAWFISPSRNDSFTILFEKPLEIKSITMSTGSVAHPSDILTSDAKVFVKKKNSNNFEDIGHFDSSGHFYADLEKNPQGVIEGFLVEFAADGTHWVFMNELSVVPK